MTPDGKSNAPTAGTLSVAVAAAAATLTCLLGVRCNGRSRSGSLYARLQDNDPAVRIEAVMEAAKKKDNKALPYLVDRLGDSESDVRFVAYMALKQLAGEVCESMQWRYYDPPAKRAEAQNRWRAWVRQRAAQSAHSQPAAGGPTDPNTSEAPRGAGKAAS